MLVLVQQQSPTSGEWTDMKVPTDPQVAPSVAGRRPRVVGPQEFADLLVRHKLVGEYRAVTSTGEVWRISVLRHDEFRAELRQEKPV